MFRRATNFTFAPKVRVARTCTSPCPKMVLTTVFEMSIWRKRRDFVVTKPGTLRSNAPKRSRPIGMSHSLFKKNIV